MNPNDYVAWVFATLTYFAVNGYGTEPKTPFTQPLTNTVARTDTGKASIFWQRTTTACGIKFARSNFRELWAAHPTLPCGLRIVVKSLVNHKEVTVIVVDRGPFIDGRIIDLTPGAAEQIGLTRKRGLMPVRLTWYTTDQQKITTKQTKPRRTRRTKRR